jgi:hypothetical protein
VTTLRRVSLEQLVSGGFGEYFDPYTGEPLGSTRQSWTAAPLPWIGWRVSGARLNRRQTLATTSPVR